MHINVTKQELLEHAIVGYRAQIDGIEKKVACIKAQIHAVTAASEQDPPVKRVVSAATRKKISLGIRRALRNKRK